MLCVCFCYPQCSYAAAAKRQKKKKFQLSINTVVLLLLFKQLWHIYSFSNSLNNSVNILFAFIFRQLQLWPNTLIPSPRLSSFGGKAFVRHPAALAGTATEASHVTIVGSLLGRTQAKTLRSRFVSLNPKIIFLMPGSREKTPHHSSPGRFWFLHCWFNTKATVCFPVSQSFFYKPLHWCCNEADDDEKPYNVWGHFACDVLTYDISTSNSWDMHDNLHHSFSLKTSKLVWI